VAVVVVVVVVVSVLALAGVFSPSRSTGQGLTGTPVSYSQVATSGASAVQSESGGPWSFVGAVGLGLTTAFSGSVAEGYVASGCTSTPAPGSPSGGTLPATPTGSPPGAVAVWMFIGTNYDTGQVLMVAVTQTATAPLFLVTGSCVADYTIAKSVNGLALVNSTSIAQDADAAGGDQFLKTYPDALQTFVLVGPGQPHTPDVPVWAADYTTCQPGATGGGFRFLAIYNGTNGSPFGSPTNESTNC